MFLIDFSFLLFLLAGILHVYQQQIMNSVLKDHWDYYMHFSETRLKILLILSTRWHWFTPVKQSQCYAGWPENSPTGFTSKADSAPAQPLKLPPVMYVWDRPSSLCVTTPTFIQVICGFVTSQRSWVVMQGSATPREDLIKTSRPWRESSFKGMFFPVYISLVWNFRRFKFGYQSVLNDIQKSKH